MFIYNTTFSCGTSCIQTIAVTGNCEVSVVIPSITRLQG